MLQGLSFKEETFHRISTMAMSIILIVETLSIDEPLGWRVIFPLLAIYPGIAALIGWDLFPSRDPFTRHASANARVDYANIPTGT